jgi:hypothetical protein
VHLTPWLIGATLLVVVGLLAAWSQDRRQKQLKAFRAAWGRPRPVTPLYDDRVREAWELCRNAADAEREIDARTWDDLDLDRLFSTIDHTHTALGQQQLYRRLRAGTTWDATPEMEALTARFAGEPPFREEVALRLRGLGRSVGYGFWIITRPEMLVVHWWYLIFPLLALVMVAAIISVAFNPQMILLVAGLMIVNLVVRAVTYRYLPGLLAPMRQLGPLIGAAEALSAVTGQRGEKMHGDEIRQLQPLKRISSLVASDASMDNELLAGFREYLNISFLLDANTLVFCVRRLRTLSPVLARVAEWVGDVDVALSVASLRAESRPWSVPAPGDGPTRVVAAWHPEIAEPVANDVELVPGRGIIITGANMSGKSTYLRTIGIAAVMARTLHTAPAERWQGRHFRVRSLIGRSDDLAAGKSYYQVEADGVVELIRDAAGSVPTIYLLDELLRGTNTVERLAAGEAVLDALLADRDGGNPHVVVVATHDGELVAMLRERYLPVHFRETIGPEGLTFDFRRREGPASTRTAIALLEATGAPASLVARARRRAEELDGGPPPPSAAAVRPRETLG